MMDWVWANIYQIWTDYRVSLWENWCERQDGKLSTVLNYQRIRTRLAKITTDVFAGPIRCDTDDAPSNQHPAFTSSFTRRFEGGVTQPENSKF